VLLTTCRKINQYFNKRYGVNLVRFTHHNKCILCASKNERIMYWSLYDNSILCSFFGHKDKITHLDVNPANSTFVSVSMDGVARVWDYE
jgi:COMPASS component SWD2